MVQVLTFDNLKLDDAHVVHLDAATPHIIQVKATHSYQMLASQRFMPNVQGERLGKDLVFNLDEDAEPELVFEGYYQYFEDVPSTDSTFGAEFTQTSAAAESGLKSPMMQVEVPEFLNEAGVTIKSGINEVFVEPWWQDLSLPALARSNAVPILTGAALIGFTIYKNTQDDDNDKTVTPVVDDNKDTVAPAVPEATLSEDGTTITGTAEPNSEVNVLLNNKTIASITVDDEGNFSHEFTTPYTNGESLRVIAVDAASNQSQGLIIDAPDVTAPDAPIVSVSVDGKQVAGFAEVDSIVTIKRDDNTVAGVVRTDEMGNYSLTLAEPLASDESISVTAKDADNNISSATLASPADNTPITEIEDEDPQAQTIIFDAADGTPVGLTVTTNDSDSVDAISYLLADDASGAYMIDATTGVVSVADSRKLVLGKQTITVKAISTDGSQMTQSFDILVVDQDNQQGSLSVSGDAKVGETLTATIEDGNGVSEQAVDYDWLVNGVLIEGAEGSTLVVPEEAAGERIIVNVNYIDDIGYSEVISSNPLTIDALSTSDSDNVDSTETETDAISKSNMTDSEPNNAIVVTSDQINTEQGQQVSDSSSDAVVNTTQAASAINYALGLSDVLTVASDRLFADVSIDSSSMTTTEALPYGWYVTPSSEEPVDVASAALSANIL